MADVVNFPAAPKPPKAAAPKVVALQPLKGPDRPTVAQLLHELGYDAPGTEIDDTVLWMMVEIKHLRGLIP